MSFAYFKNILPKVLIVILFFIITINLFQYLGLNFKEKNDQVLTKIITVETYNNKEGFGEGGCDLCQI
jgi:hypothetical protein